MSEGKPNGRRWALPVASALAGVVLATVALLTFHFTVIDRIKMERDSQAKLAAQVEANRLGIARLEEWRADYLATVTRPRIAQLERLENQMGRLEAQVDQSIQATQKDISGIQNRLNEIAQDVREIRRRGP